MNQIKENYLDKLQLKKKKMLKIFIIYSIIMMVPIAITVYFFISALRDK